MARSEQVSVVRGNPHATFDAAGAGNAARSRWCDTRKRKGEKTGNTNFDLNRRASPRPYRCTPKARVTSGGGFRQRVVNWEMDTSAVGAGYKLMSPAWRFYLGLYAGFGRTIAPFTARTHIQIALTLPIAVPLGRLFNSASPPAGLYKIGASDSIERSNPKPLCRAIYVALLVPVTLFILSLFIRPQVSYDPAYGFAVLRNMLDGGSFNYIATPNPGNIANDIETFLTWWSPGQYLVPGLFVRLGASYGVAASLTTLISTIVGILGWAQIARRFDISCFALSLFILGLVTFNYSTGPFHRYTGGEVIVFAVLPWCLTALQWAVQERPAVSFATSVLVATVLFFAKLSGLVAFVANVAGISL